MKSYAGIFIVLMPVSFAGIYFITNPAIQASSITDKSQEKIQIITSQSSEITTSKSSLSLNYTDKLNPYLNKEYQLPKNLKKIPISSATQLSTELGKANKTKGGVVFILDDGIYNLNNTLVVRADNIAFVSKSGDRNKVIIQGGNDLNTAQTGNLFRVSGKHFVLDGITLQNTRNHAIQIAGEDDADFPVIRNCILQDSFEQLLKVSYNRKSKPEISSDYGLVENCSFQYTAGIGPQFYIGGVDAIAANSWLIRNNKFKDIVSPNKSMAQYAIHFWQNSNNNMVEHNLIEDCDRGIGFGMTSGERPQNIAYSNRGGSIRNNTIIHTDNDDLFADTGISIEDSALTLIENNRIWLGHDYPRAIEYRYASTTGVIIRGNITNREITSRNGAMAEVYDNITTADQKTVLADSLFSKN